MKTLLFRFGIVLSVCASLTISGCKKDDESDNEAPVACIQANESYAFGESISFPDCSKNGKDYEWVFSTMYKTTERAPTYTYDQPGTKTVKLTVTNYKGAQDIATKTIIIRDATPQQIEGTYNVQANCSSTGVFNYSMTITPTGGNNVTITNFSGYNQLTVTGTVDLFFINIPNQTVGGVTISGTGTINQSLEVINFSYSLNENGFSESCSDYCSKQ